MELLTRIGCGVDIGLAFVLLARIDRRLVHSGKLRWSPSWTPGSGVVREPMAKPAIASLLSATHSTT
jgi:hypothetical protein